MTLLNTIILVHDNSSISPPLITTREYGNWLEEEFDASLFQGSTGNSIFMRTRKDDGTSVLEKHPGTRIGAFFDKLKPLEPGLNSYFVLEQSKVIERLVKLKLA